MELAATYRFSFYGLKAILLLYFTTYLSIPDETAVTWIHAWVFFAYATAVLGGVISDAWLGKFWTILSLSMVYCLGSSLLAITAVPGVTGEPPHWWGACVSLILVAIGTGGIKSAVSSFVGDQFTKDQEGMMTTVYSMFYFMINTGSLLSTILTPLLRQVSYSLAFGVPAILLTIATVIFVLGRNRYVRVPAGSRVFGTFFGVIFTAIAGKCRSSQGSHQENMLDYAKSKYGSQNVADVRSVLRVLLMFVPIPMFWALFDQHSTRWVLQARDMNLAIFPNVVIQPEHVTVLNPALTVLLIFVFDQGIYKPLERRGITFKSLHRILVGMFLTAISFGVAGAVQAYMGTQPSKTVSVWLVLPQFFVMTCGEVLVSITGLEFAYSQAPKTMKSIVMAAWLSTVAIGNLFVASLGSIQLPSRAYEFFLFGSAMLVCGAVFGLLIQFYVYQQHQPPSAVVSPSEKAPDSSLVEDDETGKESDIVI